MNQVVRLVPYKISSKKESAEYEEIVETEIRKFNASAGGQVNLGSKSARDTLSKMIVNALYKHKGLA